MDKAVSPFLYSPKSSMKRFLLLMSSLLLLASCFEGEAAVNPYGVYVAPEPHEYQLVLAINGEYRICDASKCESGQIQHINDEVVGLMGFYELEIGLKFDHDSDPEFANFRLQQREASKKEQDFMYFAPHRCNDTVCVWFGSKDDPFVLKRIKEFEFIGAETPIFYKIEN